MVCHAHGKSIRPTDGLKLPYWLIKKQTNMETMESLKFDELIFVVLEHEDGVKTAVEGNFGIAVFGNTIDELSDKFWSKLKIILKAHLQVASVSVNLKTP